VTHTRAVAASFTVRVRMQFIARRRQREHLQSYSHRQNKHIQSPT